MSKTPGNKQDRENAERANSMRKQWQEEAEIRLEHLKSANKQNEKLKQELAEKNAVLAEFMKHTAWAASLPEGWPNLELRKTRAKLSGHTKGVTE